MPVAGACGDRPAPRLRQRSRAIGQRVWNSQPDGRRNTLGISPRDGQVGAPLARIGNRLGLRSASRCRDAAARRTPSCVGPVSTSRPRYMMASRSLTWRIIARLWVTTMAAKPSSRFRSCDQVEHVALHRDVEAGGRLVGEQQMRAHGQRTRHADAARLAAGQLVREAVDEGAGQADLRQQARAAASAVGNRHALNDERLGEQAPDPQARAQRGDRVLEHHRRAAAHRTEVGRAYVDLPAFEDDAARRRSAAARGWHAPASSCRSRIRRPGPASRRGISARLTPSTHVEGRQRHGVEQAGEQAAPRGRSPTGSRRRAAGLMAAPHGNARHGRRPAPVESAARGRQGSKRSGQRGA